nr:hypothetical protein [Microctonus hyperodae filamentous virus]
MDVDDDDDNFFCGGGGGGGGDITARDAVAAEDDVVVNSLISLHKLLIEDKDDDKSLADIIKLIINFNNNIAPNNKFKLACDALLTYKYSDLSEILATQGFLLMQYEIILQYTDLFIWLKSQLKINKVKEKITYGSLMKTITYTLPETVPFDEYIKNVIVNKHYIVGKKFSLQNNKNMSFCRENIIGEKTYYNTKKILNNSSSSSSISNKYFTFFNEIILKINTSSVLFLELKQRELYKISHMYCHLSSGGGGGSTSIRHQRQQSGLTAHAQF